MKYEEGEIISVILSLLRAVRDAKDINISHGGIHDENVFVGLGSGRFRLGDFG